MNIESLQYFYMIAREGSISNVAKNCHISQSALSQQIQKLENSLSRKLLVRSNKGVTLTGTGQIVFQFAGNILRTYDEMIRSLLQDDESNRVIRIEASPSVADYALPCTLIKANTAYPNHNYELCSSPSAEIVSDVANNICDVGFACASDIDPNLDLICTKVGTNRIVLAAKDDGTFPDRLQAEQLLDSPLITFTRRNNIMHMLIANLKKKGLDPDGLRRSVKVEGIESAKTLVSKRYGMAFLPYISIKEELYKKQFKIIEVPDFDMDLTITMLYKKDCAAHIGDFIGWFDKHGSQSFC